MARAILANSGNANACTGRKGMDDARERPRSSRSCWDVPHEQVFIGSTGVIGKPLPMDRIRARSPAGPANSADKEERMPPGLS